MTAALIRGIPGAGMAPVTIALSARQVLAMAGPAARGSDGSDALPHPRPTDGTPTMPCR